MIGQTLSHYRIVAQLGAGGMGEVFLAEDVNLRRRVALKILPAAVADDPERMQRFQREAEAVAAINHPNIVTIHSVEESEGTRFLTMELVEGESLDRRLPDAGLSLSEIFDIAIPLADALAAAHERGIVHRDLKPANIMVTPEGRVKILDFGLAKMAPEERPPEGAAATRVATQVATLTGKGTILGTAPYMSPEQLQGRAVDHRTDIFSLGIVLYEMATGSRPFRGESSIDLASSILRDTPVSVTELKHELPRHLARVTGRCLEKDPSRRYQSALDVRNELEGLRKEVESGAEQRGLAAPTPSERTDPPVPAPPRGLGRRLRWATAGAGLLLLALAAGWWIGLGADGPERDAGPAGGITSVAVLPFADLSPDKDQEYFTDGMTEELLQALARVGGLRVPSRAAIFALKGKSPEIAEVGKRLGVEAVVEGSVRKAGDRLRIAAQLVQVSDGFELWSGTYDRRIEDVFAVQDEIGRSIAEALRVTLAPGSDRGRTSDVEAYDYYLRGQQFYERQTREGFEFACQMYRRATEIDPGYALAYNGLARCHGTLYEVYGGGSEHLEAVDRASRTVLDLAPELAEAHLARADFFKLTERPAEAEREYRTALRLNPDLARAHVSYGIFLFKEGRLEETAAAWERASELDPDDLRPIRLLPQIYRALGRPEKLEAANRRRLAVAEKRLDLNPDDVSTRLAGATSLLALGERERAFAWASEILDSGTDDALVLYNTACFYSLAGEVERALDALEKTVEAGDRDAAWWRQDSDLDAVRDHPRFRELLARIENEPR